MSRKLPRIRLPEAEVVTVQLPPLEGKICFDTGNEKIEVNPSNIEVIRELGRGAYGIVEHVRHIDSGFEMAVKRITTVSHEQRKLLMDRDVLMQTRESDCIVKFFGAFFSEGDFWLFMEKMDSSLDYFYKKYYGIQSEKKTETPVEPIPEYVLGKISANVISALDFLHKIKIIHRDVKPSNILINCLGQVKLCDFGISGYLVNSVAQTYDAGCKPYMAPERINPSREHPGYDIRSDVWSLGITILEIAIGRFPYPTATSFFEQLKRVCNDDPPRLPDDSCYSEDFKDFLNKCLQKDFQKRPNYKSLIIFPLVVDNKDKDISSFVKSVLEDSLNQ